MAYIKESFMKRKMITCIACVIFCNFITFTPVNANPTTNALLCNNKTIQLIGRAPIGTHIQQCSTSKQRILHSSSRIHRRTIIRQENVRLEKSRSNHLLADAQNLKIKRRFILFLKILV